MAHSARTFRYIPPASKSKRAHPWYNLNVWRGKYGLRRRQLRKQPLCQSCLHQGITTAAQHVDHIVPHDGDYRLFTDADNLQSLCHSCHSRKTITGK